MKKLIGFMTIVLLLGMNTFAYAIDIDLGRNATLHVFFSPKGSTTDNIVETINQAKKSIHVQAYSFTSMPIINALLAASKRGVQVELILDKSVFVDRYIGNLKSFTAINVPIYNDYKPTIAHNKIMILDSEYVITGSFNFTNNAENNNAENCLIIYSEELALFYERNYQNRKAQSKIYTGK